MRRQAWYRESGSKVLSSLRTTLERGLTPSEVEGRALEHGSNLILGAKRKSALKIFLLQFKDFMILLLIAAAAIAGFLGELADLIAIVAIVLLNALLGFVQEFRAERVMEALQALAAPHCKVRRAGQVLTIPAYDLVPGDIVLMEAGNLVPADIRLLETARFRVDESSLTGESEPIEKRNESIATDRLPVSDQSNMAFKGTLITAGRATGVVVRTGMNTELGQVAELLRKEVESQTPLQRRLMAFAHQLAIAVIGFCAILFLVGLARGEEPVLMFLTALSLAVAAIPEALPAVVTVSLALGAKVMARKNALIRKLPAVEGLGAVTYICTDKTGTLTENRMKVREGNLDSPILLQIMAQNNDVTMAQGGGLMGDPTETALYRAALEEGYDRVELDRRWPRIAEIPFSSERGLMTTVHRHSEGDEVLILTKGAPERVFSICRPDSIDLARERLRTEEMAKRGLRVLAFGYQKVPSGPRDLASFERDLIYAGLAGMMDPPRSEVKESIALCQQAGIHVVMITGDHPVTARAIASQLGILKQEPESAQVARVMTGVELSEVLEEELEKGIRSVSVYARVAPEQKIRIVQALKSVGEVVAMTGDGVNDAPALKRSDVGVAMGRGGTDVAREASAMVLLDDNFATIVSAVREGRRIYDNIRKFVRFTLSGNSGEIWTLVLAPFFQLPIPLLPIHILWVNLVTDGLPGLALAVEPEDADAMHRPPRAPNESIFARGLWQHAVWVGLLTAGSTLGTLAWAYRTGHAHWQSMAFTVLTLIQMGHVMAIRSERVSLFRLGLFSNLPLLGAIFLTFLLQMATLYVPILNRVFKTEPLTLSELLICLAASSVVFIAVEIEKWIRRARGPAFEIAPRHDKKELS